MLIAIDFTSEFIFVRADAERSSRMDAIIFDKDGTLLDFSAFWVSVTRAAVKSLARRFGAEKYDEAALFQKLGVRNGDADPFGLLCCGTYASISRAIAESLGVAEEVEEGSFLAASKAAFAENASAGEIKPACENLVPVLERLCSSGKKLFMVTTDNAKITAICLKKLGIERFFTAVITDDGVHPPKPNPYYIEKIEREYGIPRSGMCMVGDTLTDMRFAKNGGIVFYGVTRDSRMREALSEYAAAVAEHVGVLFAEDVPNEV